MFLLTCRLINSCSTMGLSDLNKTYERALVTSRQLAQLQAHWSEVMKAPSQHAKAAVTPRSPLPRGSLTRVSSTCVRRRCSLPVSLKASQGISGFFLCCFSKRISVGLLARFISTILPLHPCPSSAVSRGRRCRPLPPHGSGAADPAPPAARKPLLPCVRSAVHELRRLLSQVDLTRSQKVCC